MVEKLSCIFAVYNEGDAIYSGNTRYMLENGVMGYFPPGLTNLISSNRREKQERNIGKGMRVTKLSLIYLF